MECLHIPSKGAWIQVYKDDRDQYQRITQAPDGRSLEFLFDKLKDCWLSEDECFDGEFGPYDRSDPRPPERGWDTEVENGEEDETEVVRPGDKTACIAQRAPTGTEISVSEIRYDMVQPDSPRYVMYSCTPGSYTYWSGDESFGFAPEETEGEVSEEYCDRGFIGIRSVTRKSRPGEDPVHLIEIKDTDRTRPTAERGSVNADIILISSAFALQLFPFEKADEELRKNNEQARSDGNQKVNIRIHWYELRSDGSVEKARETPFLTFSDLWEFSSNEVFRLNRRGLVGTMAENIYGKVKAAVSEINEFSRVDRILLIKGNTWSFNFESIRRIKDLLAFLQTKNLAKDFWSFSFKTSDENRWLKPALDEGQAQKLVEGPSDHRDGQKFVLPSEFIQRLTISVRLRRRRTPARDEAPVNRDLYFSASDLNAETGFLANTSHLRDLYDKLSEVFVTRTTTPHAAFEEKGWQLPATAPKWLSLSLDEGNTEERKDKLREFNATLTKFIYHSDVECDVWFLSDGVLFQTD